MSYNPKGNWKQSHQTKKTFLTAHDKICSCTTTKPKGHIHSECKRCFRYHDMSDRGLSTVFTKYLGFSFKISLNKLYCVMYSYNVLNLMLYFR